MGQAVYSYFLKYPMLLNENSVLLIFIEIPKGISMRNTAMPTDIPMPANISRHVKGLLFNNIIPATAIGSKGKMDVRSPGA